MKRIIQLPEIPEEHRTPVITMLLKVIEQQHVTIQEFESEIVSLKEEIKRLKNHKQRPKIGPSKMDKQGKGGSGDQRRSSKKRKKTNKLRIDKVEIIPVKDVPAGAEFKGHDVFVVQELEIKTVNTKYKLERWRLPNGAYLIGELPDYLKGHHFGPTLRSYALYQYTHQGVTQPLLLDELKEWGIEISSGQLDKLLNEDKETFHEEKDDILLAGLTHSDYIHVDDTGARHKGKNGYCTHIGNEFFAWFESTASKSRINFLELLRRNHCDYRIDENALDYLKQQGLSKEIRQKLAAHCGTFKNKQLWELHLKNLDITRKRHCKIATEGALVGSVLSHGFNINLAIISDDAGQFNIFQHALCWIHAERKINELIPMSTLQAAAISGIRNFFWQFYADLKAYREAPNEEWKKKLGGQFDALCGTQTCFESLNQALKRIKRNKSELLLVLERPEIPLHNNLSERDIRDYVKKRKVSGGTRSEKGRRCRDTFSSLKKTCKKLGIPFWAYLVDRVFENHQIPLLPALIQQVAVLK